MFVVKEIIDSVKCICAYVFNEIFKFLIVLGGELARMGADDCDEGCSFLTKELIKFL